MSTIFPSNPNVDDIYQGYKWNGTAWKLIAPNTGMKVTVEVSSYGDLENGQDFPVIYL